MRDRRRERWLEGAERVRDEFGLVLVLVLTTYVLMSLLGDRGWASVAICAVTSATSVIALTSSRVQERFVRLALTLSVISVTMAVVGAISGALLWLNLSSLIQVGLLVTATGAVLLRVITAPEVSSRTILGAISVYTVLGILFTYVYATVDRLQRGEFFEGVPKTHAGDFLFFSYTTLTTTGFGDLVPGGQPGRLISGIEMIVGQIFLVTLVAGLVALWKPGESLRRRREARQQGVEASVD